MGSENQGVLGVYNYDFYNKTTESIAIFNYHHIYEVRNCKCVFMLNKVQSTLRYVWVLYCKEDHYGYSYLTHMNWEQKKPAYFLMPMLPSAQGLQFMIFSHRSVGQKIMPCWWLHTQNLDFTFLTVQVRA